MSRSIPFLQYKTRTIVRHAGWLAAISILYAAVFLLPLPPQFKRQGIFLVDELILLLLLVLVFLTYRRPGWGAKYLRLGIILIAFTLPLLRLWETGESTWNIVLGLLPWADAAQYYFDASRLLEGGLFSAFSGRRPLYASLLALLLKMSGQNLQIVLSVFTIINALAVFLFVEEINNELGSFSAIVALYLSQLFYRPFVGTVLTEQLGYPIGLLALVVLIRAVKTNKLWLFSLGMALLTYALLIRAGTFFVLPLLILFAVLYFAKNRQQYLRVLFVMVMALAIPVVSNLWLGQVAASPSAVEFSNFADTLYGQARGGVRWTQAAIDHPELASMAEPDRSRLLYQLTFAEIKRNPLGLIRGSIKALVDFIRPGPLSAFGFLTFGNKGVDLVSQVSAALLFLFGLWKSWMDRRNSISALILIFWAGTFFSIPFLPPVDAGIRPYAATIASVFLPICLVFSQGFFRRVENSQDENRIIPVGISYTSAFLLILLSLAGAPLLRTIVKPIPVPPATCEAGLIPVSFRLSHGSYILLSSVDEAPRTKVPVVLLTDVQRSFDDFPYGDFASLIRKIKQPALITAASDVSTGQGIWAIAPARTVANEGEVISGCAKLLSPFYSVLQIEEVTNK